MRRRVTVVGSVCVCVCVSVCVSVCLSVKSHLTSGASVRPENTVTCLATTKIKKFVGFSLKPLSCRDPALSLLKGHTYVRPFSCGKRACAFQ